MTDFEDALNAALHGRNQEARKAFEQADADLHELVQEASEALGRVTRKKATLGLDPTYEEPDGTVYELLLTINEKEIPIGGYFVSEAGYPIYRGTPDSLATEIRASTTSPHPLDQKKAISDRAALQKHLLDLLSSPDSSVVIHVAYHSRYQELKRHVTSFLSRHRDVSGFKLIVSPADLIEIQGATPSGPDFSKPPATWLGLPLTTATDPMGQSRIVEAESGKITLV